jgi:hypothetical protein
VHTRKNTGRDIDDGALRGFDSGGAGHGDGDAGGGRGALRAGERVIADADGGPMHGRATDWFVGLGIGWCACSEAAAARRVIGFVAVLTSPALLVVVDRFTTKQASEAAPTIIEGVITGLAPVSV